MMYQAFFGLKKRPFSAVPDTESYFDVGSIAESRKTIENVIRSSEGISLVFGAAGTGKTLLLRLLRQNFEWDYTVLPIINGLIDSPKVLYQQLLYHLHLPFAGQAAAELRMQLFDYVRQQVTRGTVLLFDESQYLYPDVLEEIRLLADETACRFHTVLAGSIDFEEKLTIPQLEAFNQRVAALCYLEPFTCEETLRYITRQIQHSFQTGYSVSAAEAMQHSEAKEVHRIDPPHRNSHLFFGENAKRRIHTLTGGLPRLVNQLCDKTLRLAAEKNIFRIEDLSVNEAWSLIQHIEPAAVVEGENVMSMQDIDDIVSKKRKTLQLRPFETTIEFGSLDDTPDEAESPEETAASVLYDAALCDSAMPAMLPEFAVYKPAYPELDDEGSDDAVNVAVAVNDAVAEETADGNAGGNAMHQESGLENTSRLPSVTNSQLEDDMDAKTLEEYGEAVLKDRLPFVRKEPDYAYQTTAAAPEAVRNIEYPGTSTGSVVVLNWQQNASNDAHFGVAYSEYQSLEKESGKQGQNNDAVLNGGVVNDTARERTLSPESAIIRTVFNTAVEGYAPAQSSIDEIFIETKTVETKTVPLSAVYKADADKADGRQMLNRVPETSDIDAAIEKRLEKVVDCITAAAAKIEQAAEISSTAGRQITESAQFIKTEIKSALPSYIDMFQELSEFQKTVLSELDAMRLNTDLLNVRTLLPRRQIAIERSVPAIDVDSLFQ
jgi:MSHA biogenesis protein MshM